MASFYSVVQYVPDPSTDERINIGLLAIGDGRVRSRFVKDWRRVRQFAGSSVSFLPDVVASIQRVSEADVRSYVVDWKNTVQLTPLRASTLHPEELLDQLAPQLLRGLSAPTPRPHGHAYAVKVTRRAIKKAVSATLGHQAALKLIREDEPIRGKHMEHHLDLALRNGNLLTGVFAISFRVQEPSLESQLRAKLYSLRDVHQRHPQLNLAVAALLPNTAAGRREYGQASEAIAAEKARLVPETELPKWANEVAKNIHL